MRATARKKKHQDDTPKQEVDTVNIAIQTTLDGKFRLVSFENFTDDEGNPAVEIISVHNQGEVEWYDYISYAIDDLKDFVATPAPWSQSCTVCYNLLGPGRRKAYWLLSSTITNPTVPSARKLHDPVMKHIMNDEQLTHEKDEDCAGHLEDGCCVVCGAGHGDPCQECSGTGYHREGCSLSDASYA
jgi:hypothetical protein